MLPLFEQEKRNTCGLACLRMVLAAFGRTVEESELEAQAQLEEDGILIDELAHLARRFNLVADILDAPVDTLQGLLDAGSFPVAYIDRAVFDLTPKQRRAHSIRNAKIHSVIPIRVTAAAVTFHDPLFPRVRRENLSLFRRAYHGLGGLSVVCSEADSLESRQE